MKGGPGEAASGAGQAVAPPVAVQKCYDLALYLMQHIEKFPRSHKFTLGDRLGAALDVPENLMVAAVHDFSRGWFGRRLLT